MSTGPGNDPFSGSNVRNIISHIVSPKIVNDGSGGFTVATDLINVDDAYVNGTVYMSNMDTQPIGGIIETTATIQTNIDVNAGIEPHHIFANSSGVNCWAIGVQNVQTGSNVGADMYFYSYDDTGNPITAPLTLTRSTGAVATPTGFYGKSKGTVTLVAGTKQQSDTAVSASSDILLTLNTVGGTGTGNAYVSAKTSGSFTVTSVAGSGDTSTFNYIVLN